jgi:hypothetical protein
MKLPDVANSTPASSGEAVIEQNPAGNGVPSLTVPAQLLPPSVERRCPPKPQVSIMPP